MKRTIREIVQSDKHPGMIIDNTNATIKNRDEWFQCIDDTWLKCIIYINIPKALSFHFVKNREMYINKHIPDVAVHSFYKRLELPHSKRSTRYTIKSTHFVPRFQSFFTLYIIV